MIAHAMTNLPNEPHDGAADPHARIEERLAWLTHTQQDLARTIKLAPWLALSALLAVPVGLAWGIFAAAAVAGFGLLLPMVIFYLSWCHQQEYASEEATLREHLEVPPDAPRTSSARPWRVRGKATQLGE